MCRVILELGVSLLLVLLELTHHLVDLEQDTRPLLGGLDIHLLGGLDIHLLEGLGIPLLVDLGSLLLEGLGFPLWEGPLEAPLAEDIPLLLVE